MSPFLRRYGTSCALGAALVTYVLAGCFSIAVHAGQARTANDGVYTDAQAKRGQAIFKDRCTMCHGEKLEGELGPPLTGPEFVGTWGNQALSELVNKIERTMPDNDPGTTTRPQAADLVAFILSTGKFPVGKGELSTDDAVLKQITLSSQTAAAPPAARAAAAAGPTFVPAGNLAQVMRGIMFPSSNLIFNVQNQDPGAQKVGWEPGQTAFSWADWGAGIYSGWEMVDYAAIALADAAPLILTPRRCENGKPAPVDRPDWIKFTQGVADAGRAAYKASQSRNRDAVIEATNQLADACLACHEVYRDKPGGSAADPSNKAARCVP